MVQNHWNIALATSSSFLFNPQRDNTDVGILHPDRNFKFLGA